MTAAGPIPEPLDVVTMFLGGAHVVAEAIADPSVAAAWDQPSVLEDQTVSGLAGHLARGSVWGVADYLDAGPPTGPVDFDSAGEYFAAVVSMASPDLHQAVRERGAAVGSVGHQALATTLVERIEAMGPRLRSLDAGQLIGVVFGKVMRLDDYLVTRMVEQVVHLDDLARSVDHEPWPMPLGAQELAITVGMDIAQRRCGSGAVVRALYRQGFAEAALPVL